MSDPGLDALERLSRLFLKDRSQIASSAAAQPTSLLHRTPPEIRRQIFECLWEATNIHKQHVYEVNGEWHLSPCFIDSDEEDEMYDEIAKLWEQSFEMRQVAPPLPYTRRVLESKVWASRLDDPWNRHWECYEGGPSTEDFHTSCPASRTLAIVLSCKTLYLEAIDSLRERMTLVLVHPALARTLFHKIRPNFLQHIRTIELSFRDDLQNVRHSRYYPIAEEGHLTMKGKCDLWDEVFGGIGSLDSLATLKLWLDDDSDQRYILRYQRGILTHLGDKLAKRTVLNLPLDHPPMWLQQHEDSGGSSSVNRKISVRGSKLRGHGRYWRFGDDGIVPGRNEEQVRGAHHVTNCQKKRKG